jgi:hypothetical protein
VLVPATWNRYLLVAGLPHGSSFFVLGRQISLRCFMRPILAAFRGKEKKAGVQLSTPAFAVLVSEKLSVPLV